MVEINDTLSETMNITLNYTKMYYEELAKSSDLTVWLVLIIIILAIGVISFVIYHKTNKQRKEDIKKQQQILKEIILAYETLDTKGKQIDEININNLPKDLQERMLDDTSLFGRLFFKNDKGKQWKEPLLLLIQKDGKIKIKQNAKEGDIPIKQNDMTKSSATISLRFPKILTLVNGNQKIKVWIHFEGEHESYPIEEGHSAKATYEIIRAIQLNKLNQTPVKKGIPKIVWILGGLALLIGILYISGAFDALFGKEIVEAVVNTTSNMTQNVTNINTYAQETKETTTIIL